MNQAETKELISFLEEKGATKSCHRCGHPDFNILEEIFPLSVQRTDTFNKKFNLQLFTTYAVVCKNCGAVTFHLIENK